MAKSFAQLMQDMGAIMGEVAAKNPSPALSAAAAAAPVIGAAVQAINTPGVSTGDKIKIGLAGAGAIAGTSFTGGAANTVSEFEEFLGPIGALIDDLFEAQAPALASSGVIVPTPAAPPAA